MPHDYEIVLPATVRLVDALDAIGEPPAPLVARHVSGLHFRPQMRSPGAVVVDWRQTRECHPDARVALLAFTAWARRENKSGGVVKEKRGQYRIDPLASLIADLSEEAGIGEKDLSWHLELDALLPEATTARDAIHRNADALTTAALSMLEGERTTAIQKAVAEFFLEGLQNVADHAWTGNATLKVPAWVAAGVTDLSPGLPVPAIGRWHEYHRHRGATRCLTVAIADIGEGIPATLGHAYEAQHPVSSSPGHQRRNLVLRHDHIMRWALSPFGSRKTRADYDSEATADAWRGLYRISHRLRLCGGLMLVRSGFGAYGGASRGQESEPFSLSEAATHRRVVPWPGTLLVACIPLPAEASRSEPVSQSQGRRDCRVASARALPQRPMGRSGFESAEVEPYAAQVSRALLIEASSRYEDAGRTTGPFREFVMLVHPAVSVGNTELTPDATHSVHVENTAAARLARVLGMTVTPGLIPVHAMLLVQDSVLQHAADLLAASRDGSYSLLAVASVETGELRWLLRAPADSIDNAAKVAEQFDDVLSRGLLVTASPLWFSELSASYPSLFVTHQAQAGLTLQARLPTHLDIHSRRQALEASLRTLADGDAASATGWLWRSSDLAKEVVRTTRDRFVETFVSTYALCVHHGVVEIALRGLLGTYLDQGAVEFVVPANSTSAYLVARRLVSRLRGKEDSLVHPDDVARRVPDGSRVVVITDLIYSGSHLVHAHALLPSGLVQAEMFACIDATPEVPSTDDDASPSITAFCRLPMPPPVSPKPGTQVLTVDPLTNEILEPWAAEEAARFGSLVWGRQFDTWKASDDGLVPPGLIEYGLRFFGGRLHLVRCPADRVVHDRALRARLVDNLAASVARAGTLDAVVLCARDESTMYGALYEIARELSKRMQEKYGGAPAVYTAPVLSVRRNERQTLRHNTASSLAQARLVTAGRQLSFPSGTEDWAARSFAAVYVDNSAITGRALREFAVAFAQLSDAKAQPRQIVLCPVVDKLSPSHEALFTRFSVNPTSGAPTPVAFTSVLQARIRSYRRLDEVPFVASLRPVFEAMTESASEKLSDLASQARVEAESLATTAVTVPLAPARKAPPTSVDAVLARHLLAMIRQGQPLVAALLNTVRALARARDYSLLTVFALEPDLHVDDVVERVLAPEITSLALAALVAEDAATEVRLNALATLALRRRGFGAESRAVALASVKSEPLVQLWWAALVRYAGATSSRAGNIASALQALSEVQGEKASSLRDAEALLRATALIAPLVAPATATEMRSAIVSMLRACRSHHGALGFAAWIAIRSSVIALERNQDHDVGPDELTDAMFEQVERLLQQVVIPGAQAVFGLAQRAGRSERRAISRSVEQVASAFDACRGCVVRLRRGDATADELAAAWRILETLTLPQPIEWLMVRDAAAVLGHRDRAGAPFSHLLLDVVMDPIACALQTVSAVARGAHKKAIEVRVAYGAVAKATVFSALDQSVTDVYRRWQTGPTVPVLWGHSGQWREIWRILAENITRYADPQESVTLDVSATDDDVVLKLRCTQMGVVSGNGVGHQQVRRLIAGVGKFTTTTTGRRFEARVVLTDVQHVSLPSVADIA